MEFVAVIDETIAQYSEGLPLMHDTLEALLGKATLFGLFISLSISCYNMQEIR